MSANDDITDVISHARQLVTSIKTGEAFTVHQARQLYGQIREAEGWLLSARQLLDPSENGVTP
jgi:hypothetical protein